MRAIPLLALAISLAMPAAALAQGATDRTVDVRQGTRLALGATHGSVTVRTWDRSSVRIQARHDPRQVIEIDHSGPLLKVGARQHGKKDNVDYTLTVPRWMDLNLSGVYAPITVQAAGGRIQASNVNGSIDVRGGTEVIEVISVQGAVLLAGARGRISASSVNGGVTIADCSGPIVVESVNGGLNLTRIDSRSVQAETVNGGIQYDGAVYADGVYRLTTHHGPVTFTIPAGTGADVKVSTFNGSFSSSFPIDLQEGRRGKSFSFVLGAGGADIELESFNGPVRLRRAGGR